MKIYWITKIGPKGQVVIPQEARQDFNLKPWDKIIIISPSQDWLVILPAEEVKKHLKLFENIFNSLEEGSDEK